MVYVEVMIMLIHEAAIRSGTTKKAIEYYCQKGLLNPAYSENGYRVFSDKDVEDLKKISLLRSLGVSVEDIRPLLHGDDSTSIQRILDEQERDLQRRKEQNDLLRELASSMDWDAVHCKITAIESRQSVMERLMKAFPGFWGKSLSLHFRQFLMEPVQTKEQENAYHEICAYLDSVQLEIPEELEQYMNDLDTQDAQDVSLQTNNALSDAVNDPESWLKDNREMIEQYLALQKTPEYLISPAARLMEFLKTFNQEQGYNTIFIPAMRRLSPAYDAYILKLQKADQIFSQHYGQ